MTAKCERVFFGWVVLGPPAKLSWGVLSFLPSRDTGNEKDLSQCIGSPELSPLKKTTKFWVSDEVYLKV